MSVYSKEQEEFFKEHIRKVMVRRPKASGVTIKSELEKLNPPISLDKDFIIKLRNEIVWEAAENVRKQTVEEEVGKFEMVFDESVAQLNAFIADDNADPKIKISAVREIVDAYKTLFQIKFDAGIFSKKLGELNVNDKNPVTDEQRREQVRRVLEELKGNGLVI